MGRIKAYYHDEIERMQRGLDDVPSMADMASHCEWCGVRFRVTDRRIEIPRVGVVCSDDCAIDLQRSEAGRPLMRPSCRYPD